MCNETIKTYLVVGANEGIGRAVADLIVSKGAEGQWNENVRY
ncbi:hypothetical protein [Xenorhabdus bharatensis]